MSDLANYPQEDNFSTRLASAAASGDVTIMVNTNVTFTFADPFYIVVEPGTTNAEPMLVTGISGTTWTVTRAQKRYTGDAGSAIAHPAGGTVIISDNFASWNDIKTATNSKADTASPSFTGEMVVPVFADATARDAAIAAPTNGAECYLTAEGKFTDYTGGVWTDRASGTTSNASETVAGKVELATNAEMGTSTSTGGTGARLVPPNDQLVKASSGAGDENKLAVLNASGQFADGFINTATIGVIPTGGITMWFTNTAPSGHLICDGAVANRTTYSALFNLLNPSVGTATMTIASPAVVTLATHGLIVDDTIYFTTTGTLPTNVVANTRYYVVAAGLTASEFQFATSSGGTAITSTGTQSGVHTVFRTYSGVGNGSTTFNLPDLGGYVPAGRDTAQAEFNAIGYTAGAKTHTLVTSEMPAHTHEVTFQQFASGEGGGGFAVSNGTAGANTKTSGSTGGGGAHNNLQPYVTLNFIIKT